MIFYLVLFYWLSYILNSLNMLLWINILLRVRKLIIIYLKKNYYQFLQEINWKLYISFFLFHLKLILNEYLKMLNKFFKKEILDLYIFNKFGFKNKNFGNFFKRIKDKFFFKKIRIGALTDKFYAFRARAWELNIVVVVDFLNALGSLMEVAVSDMEIKRILPSQSDFRNEDWLSNKIRYYYESLNTWRINIPLFRKNSQMIYVSWIKGFFLFFLIIWFFSIFFINSKILILPGVLFDSELIVTSKILIKKLGFLLFDTKNNININDYYLYYINPNFIKNLNDKNIFILLGYNLRLESPILNIKLRKKMLCDEIFYYTIGSVFNDNLNSKMLGLKINNLISYLIGKVKNCYTVLKQFKKVKNIFFDLNTFLIGNNMLMRFDVKHLFLTLKTSQDMVKILNYNYNNELKSSLSYFLINFLKNNLIFYSNLKNLDVFKNLNIIYMNICLFLYDDLNFNITTYNVDFIKKNDIIYFLGIDFLIKKKQNFFIFQGHHLDLAYFSMDLIFPSITFFEKYSTFLNIEGNLLQSNFVVNPPIFSRNDWSIMYSLYLYTLKIVFKIFDFDIKSKLNLNRIYVFFVNFKQQVFFLQKWSINFFFKILTLSSRYIYNINNNFKFLSKIFRYFGNSVITHIHNIGEIVLDVVNSIGFIYTNTPTYFDKFFGKN